MNFLILPIFLLTAFISILPTLQNREYHIFHCRSYLSTLIVIFLKKYKKGIKVIFDMRGLYPEEGIIHKKWTQRSVSFKIWKWIEKRLLQKSDKVIALSYPMAEYLKNLNGKTNLGIVGPCVDLVAFNFNSRFKFNQRVKYGLIKERVFVYCGGLGSWHNPDMLGLIFKKIKTVIQDSYFLIITPYNAYKLALILENHGIKRQEFKIIKVEPSEVPLYLIIGDYGILPYDKTDQLNDPRVKVGLTLASKCGEYLACGLPIIANKYAGGVSELIDKFNVGVTFDPNNIDEILYKISYLENNYDELKKNSLKVARKLFNVKRHAKSYMKIYKELTTEPS